MLLRHKVLQPPTPKSHQSRAYARTRIVFWHSCVALIKSQVINHHQRAYHRHIATDTACGFFVVAKSPTERSPWARHTHAHARRQPSGTNSLSQCVCASVRPNGERAHQVAPRESILKVVLILDAESFTLHSTLLGATNACVRVCVCVSVIK